MATKDVAYIIIFSVIFGLMAIYALFKLVSDYIRTRYARKWLAEGPNLPETCFYLWHLPKRSIWKFESSTLNIKCKRNNKLGGVMFDDSVILSGKFNPKNGKLFIQTRPLIYSDEIIFIHTFQLVVIGQEVNLHYLERMNSYTKIVEYVNVYYTFDHISNSVLV